MAKKVKKLNRPIAIAALISAFAQPANADGDVAYGEYLSGECVTCHQMSGATNGIPAIVGWDEEIFISVLDEYRKKIRPNEAMQTIAARLKDDEVAALAAYFKTIIPQQ